MKPYVNLATDPFRNRRLFWVGVLMFFLLPAYAGQLAIQEKIARDSQITELQRRLQVGGQRGDEGSNTIKTIPVISFEQNQEIYAASELLARKSFSWSHLLDEIERNLPAGVRLLRVGVSTIVPVEKNGAFGGPESAATLTMDVIGKSNGDVTSMINRFHDSGRFRVSPLTQKPIEGTEEVEFSLKVDYFPPAARPLAAAPSRPRDVSTTASERQISRPEVKP
jgi:Tfp pilus assembly protein PilN